MRPVGLYRPADVTVVKLDETAAPALVWSPPKPKAKVVGPDAPCEDAGADDEVLDSDGGNLLDEYESLGPWSQAGTTSSAHPSGILATPTGISQLSLGCRNMLLAHIVMVAATEADWLKKLM